MRVAELIGERLLIARRRAKLDQTEVGKRLGVSGAAVGNWERGSRQPDWDMLYRLASIYQVGVGFFFEGINEAEIDLGHFLANGRVLAGVGV